MKNHFKSQEQSFCKLLKDFSYDPMQAVNNQIGPILMSINPKSDMITLTAGQCKERLIGRYDMISIGSLKTKLFWIK